MLAGVWGRVAGCTGACVASMRPELILQAGLLVLVRSIFLTQELDYNAQVYGAGVWAALALMCASALCGSITDLAFDLEGYLWQLVNCLFTASYSLYLRGVMDKVVGLTVNKTRLDEFSMVCLSSKSSVGQPAHIHAQAVLAASDE